MPVSRRSRPGSPPIRWITAGLAAAVLALGLAPAPAGAAKAQPLGLPSGASLLFVLQAESGSLTHRSGRNYLLTLRRPGRHSAWFTDRPTRDSGRISNRQLVGAWKRLGFTADRPNAALTTTRKGPDDLIVELGRPRLRDGGRLMQMPVRRLGRSRRAIPKRFGSASLFIDNAAVNATCGYTGEVDLYPRGLTPTEGDYVPADGGSVRITSYPSLFAVVGRRFGGGDGYFNLPTISAPDGYHAVVCGFGAQPQTAPSAVNLYRATCEPGQIQLFSQTDTVWGYVPADGRSLPIADQPLLFTLVGTIYGGDGVSTFNVPSMPAPPAGSSWQICAFGEPSPDASPCILSELDYWGVDASVPGPDRVSFTSWMLARGLILPIRQYTDLWELLSADFGGDGLRTFALPNVPSPAPGVQAYVCTSGTYPQRG